LVLRQLEVSKKAICFVQWKIKVLLGCNPENSFEYPPGQGQPLSYIILLGKELWKDAVTHVKKSLFRVACD